MLKSIYNMLVLLYGSNGWIGGQFVDVMKNNNINYVCGKSRIDNDETLEDEIKQIYFF